MKNTIKKYFTNGITTIGFISLIIFGIIYYNNDYMKYKDRKCTILDKIITNGSYKSSGRFYLVLKDERDIVFDLIVSPATFYQSTIGNTGYFTLRELDIRQTTMNNTIYFFGFIVFGVIAFIFLIGGLIDVRYSNKIKNTK